MKVIFIEDVPDVGLAGETKDVADGFGRNYLLPKKLAVLANSAASNIVEVQLKKVMQKRALAEQEMKALAEKINGVELTIKARVGEKERLYGSVTGADIAAALAAVIERDVDKRKIDLAEPIRQIGTHDVAVRFTHDITAVIRVTVEADQVIEEKPEKEEKKPKTRAKKAEEPEASFEEPAAQLEEPEVQVEEPEAQVEEPSAKLEEAEAAVEEPAKKAKKPKAKAKKKAKEPEAQAEAAETTVEAAADAGVNTEETETESGE